VLLGKTLGKLVTRTAIADKASLSQLFIRSLVRFIPFEPFYLLFSERKRALHDRLSHTTIHKIHNP
jgi:uncharacterized RDD family membrane protein YckC